MTDWDNKKEQASENQTSSEPFVGDLNDMNQQENHQQKTEDAVRQKWKSEKHSQEKDEDTSDWEKKLIRELALNALNEQRRSRRWGIFFKLLTAIYVAIVIALWVAPVDNEMSGIGDEPHTALINIEGVIAADSDASADKIVTSLREAFKDKYTKGVILRMNTPGGSPVQSAYVNDEIYRLKAKHPDIPVYAVISDVCASGGYYIAAAADEIYANKGSIVGSIGVIMNGFGFVEAMKKLGVSRRVYTSGDHKAFLDPFSPQNDTEIAHVNSMLKNVHEQFIAVVKKGRKDKLVNDKNIFSGFFWTGEKAIEKGLVDKLGSSSFVAREVIGVEKIKEYSYRDSLIERFGKQLGVIANNWLMESQYSLQLR